MLRKTVSATLIDLFAFPSLHVLALLVSLAASLKDISDTPDKTRNFVFREAKKNV